MIAIAFPDTRLSQIGDFLRAAVRALHLTVRPSKRSHVLAAMLEIGKENHCVLKSGGVHE
jgi:hypothetical protein